MSKAKQLLLDYRTTPNCGEYGVTRGWMERVDEAIKEIDAREAELVEMRAVMRAEMITMKDALLAQWKKEQEQERDEAIVRDRKARDED